MRGQSTVEAAVLLPTVMVLLALLLQPACILYTRMVMCSAAASSARVLATLPTSSLGECEDYVLRRLAAVPEVAPFHVGGRDDWVVGVGCDGGTATVSIRGHVRLLPLFGVAMSALGAGDSAGTVIEVSVSERVRPKWLGGDYGSWISMWS